MQQFTAAQVALIYGLLDLRYGEGGALDGSLLVDGSVTFAKLDETTLYAGLDARYRDYPVVDIYVQTSPTGALRHLRVRAEDLGDA